MLKYELKDTHTHTGFSFDVPEGSVTAEDICIAAKNAQLLGVAITDHLEVNSEVEGLYRKFDFEGRRTELGKAKEIYGDFLSVGIELGQPIHYPELAQRLLSEGGFEFVVGSVHNIRNTPDFALMDFQNMPRDKVDEYWDRYLDEYLELCDFPGIDAFAHLTYPLRYFGRSGYEPDISRWEGKICKILKKIKNRGAALEVNTSGYRKNMLGPLPPVYVLCLYSKIGGERITLGSDAHRACDVGADFDKAIREIKGI